MEVLPVPHPSAPTRTGFFYLPSLKPAAGHPVLVVLHGYSSDGRYMINLFADAAKKHGIALLAPDSATKSWDVPAAGASNDDVRYVATCLQWLQQHAGNQDSKRLGIVGHSFGTRMAAALGTQYGAYTALMLAHGRYVPETLGTNLLPVWFSGSPGDKIFSYAIMQSLAQPGQPMTVGRETILTPFDGTPNTDQHTPTPPEIDAMVSWFLAHPR